MLGQQTSMVRGNQRGSKKPGVKRWRDVKPNDLQEIPSLKQRIALECVDSGRDWALFEDFPISRRTANGLSEHNYIKPTEIQAMAIPPGLLGRDLVGQSKTGSGKTIAFLVPVVENLYRERWSKDDGLGALILSPTRELATQIFSVITRMGKQHDFCAGCIFGGKSVRDEERTIGSINILVATPGRLLQHLDESPTFVTHNLKMLVLDEVDRMVDMGFRESMEAIVSQLPPPSERQTLLYSATIDEEVLHLVGKVMKKDFVHLSTATAESSVTPSQLNQVYIVTPLHKKVDILFSFLKSHARKKLLVFVSACKQVRFFAEVFRRLKPGCAILELHGRLGQQKRLDVFQEFVAKSTHVALICTDVAARGVDFPSVDWVIQVDCPESVESYIHRVGRTARHAACGSGLLLLLRREEAFVDALRNRKIMLKKLSVNPSKFFSLQRKLEGMVAASPELKGVAERAVAAYCRSVNQMPNKAFASATSLPIEDLARSMGLVGVPAGVKAAVAEISNGTATKTRVPGKLERFKAKIAARKAKLKDAEEIQSDSDGTCSDDDGNPETRAMSRAEKRRARLQQLRAARPQQRIEMPEEEDSILEEKEAPVVEETTNVWSGAAVQAALRKGRIRFRADGSAKVKGLGVLQRIETEMNHVFFDESDSDGDSKRKRRDAFEAVAEKLDQDSAPVAQEMQSSHVESVRARIRALNAEDSRREKLRIREKHFREKGKAALAKDEEVDELDSNEATTSEDDIPQQKKRRKDTSALEEEALRQIGVF
eukprot:Polyplicarium_translucidae@DN2497_c0_g1_i1.p1